MAALKVFRTATGFHDAYVAAPSRKAALAAWGTTKDLFARGAAEVVTDPERTAEPLAAPGQVFRRVRGSEAEQIAALGEPLPARKARAAPAERVAPLRKPRLVKPPKPSREQVDLAETAVEQLAARHAEASAALADEARELAERQRALKTAQAEEIPAAKLRVASERRTYEAALARWSSD